MITKVECSCLGVRSGKNDNSWDGSREDNRVNAHYLGKKGGSTTDCTEI